MKDDSKFVQDALDSLRFDGEPQADALHSTQERLMKLHGKEVRGSMLSRRLWIASAFVLALGVGAAAGPRVLEWWEHLVVTVDEELPDGSHHVVIEEDGQPVFDGTLQPDEAIFQIQPDEDGDQPTLIQVAPENQPPEKEKEKPR